MDLPPFGGNLPFPPVNIPGQPGGRFDGPILARVGGGEDIDSLIEQVYNETEPGHFETPAPPEEISAAEQALIDGEWQGGDFNQVPSFLKVTEGKVGGKVPVGEYAALRRQSVKNPEAGSLTLGKYTPTVIDGVEDWTTPGIDSYIARAASNSMYFDLGSRFAVVQEQYGLTDIEMFEYFNQPVLEDAIKSGKEIRFSHDPREVRGFLKREWDHIKQRLRLTDADLAWREGFWYVK